MMDYKTKMHFYSVLRNAGFKNLEDFKFSRLSSGAGIFTSDLETVIVYGDTIVLHHLAMRYTILNTAGWKTVTTKKWINYGLQWIGLDAGIFQKRGIWYLKRGDKIEEYNDFMKLRPV